MIRDFSHAAYLGWRHGSGELPAWKALSTGVPAAFLESPQAVAMGKAVARLQGLEDGVVSVSSLHLFWDWFGGLRPKRHVVFSDGRLYPIGRCGVERAAGKGVETHRFRHLCATSLRRTLQERLPGGRRPVVVTDGWCPLCGKPAPVGDYLNVIEPYGGLLVMDDTQALGVLGQQPDAEGRYGYGGGGLLRYAGVHHPSIVVIASLAKAFGVPMAVLSGAAEQVAAFKRRSETRMCAGPPSLAHLLAAGNALRLNAAEGDLRRNTLLRNVALFRARAAGMGLIVGGGIFPVQTFLNVAPDTALALHTALWHKNVRTVPVVTHSNRPQLCWILNARHSPADIESACQALRSALRSLQGRTSLPTQTFRHEKSANSHPSSPARPL